jgi:hypothetical protein
LLKINKYFYFNFTKINLPAITIFRNNNDKFEEIDYEIEADVNLFQEFLSGMYILFIDQEFCDVEETLDYTEIFIDYYLETILNLNTYFTINNNIFLKNIYKKITLDNFNIRDFLINYFNESNKNYMYSKDSTQVKTYTPFYIKTLY